VGSSRTACCSLLFDFSANASTNSLLMLPCKRIIAAMGSGKGCIRFGCNPAMSLVAGTSTTIWSGRLGLGVFGQKGSLFFTRPTLNTYAAARAGLSAMAKDLFEVVLSGAVKIEIKQTYPLKDAAQAHRDLESRKTVGSTVLTV
jgi:hypothetical protein